MEELVYEQLRKKKFFTPQDIQSLIVLCDRLFKRNSEISSELEKALGKLATMQRRLEFYRQVTVKEMK